MDWKHGEAGKKGDHVFVKSRIVCLCLKGWRRSAVNCNTIFSLKLKCAISGGLFEIHACIQFTCCCPVRFKFNIWCVSRCLTMTATVHKQSKIALLLACSKWFYFIMVTGQQGIANGNYILSTGLNGHEVQGLFHEPYLTIVGSLITTIFYHYSTYEVILRDVLSSQKQKYHHFEAKLAVWTNVCQG